jgi:hypothetical protein
MENNILAAVLFLGSLGCFLKACAAKKGSRAHGLWWMTTAFVVGCELAASGVFHWSG